MVGKYLQSKSMKESLNLEEERVRDKDILNILLRKAYSMGQ